MIRHVVFFTFTADHDPAVLEEWRALLDGLVGKIPGLVRLSHGPDVMRSERAWDYALVADFRTLDDVHAYTTHPEHLPLFPLSSAISEQIASVDFEVDEQ